jgi:hypothetical protein
MAAQKKGQGPKPLPLSPISYHCGVDFTAVPYPFRFTRNHQVSFQVGVNIDTAHL